MALFGRRKAKPAESTVEEQEEEIVTDGGDSASSLRGPRDSEGQTVPKGYLDLGALYVPVVPGMQLRAQFEPDKVSLRRILLVIGTSGVQVSIAAAPRSGGLWEELSQQITAGLEQAGGNYTLEEGVYGTEIHANVAVRLPDGNEGYTPLRIIGVDGPRWLARIDIQGAAAAGDEEQLEKCMEIIDKLIINRGSEPRVRMELLPLRLPKGAVGTDGAI